MGREISTLEKWKDSLSKYYNTPTIERYYRKHKGSTKELARLSLKNLKARHFNSVTYQILRKKYQGCSFNLQGCGESSAMKRRKRKGAVIYLIDKQEKAFDDFFNNKLFTFFEDKGIGFHAEETIDKLDIILKDYYDEFHEIEELKTLIKKDSYSEIEKEINKILEKTNKILKLTRSDLYNTLPKKIKIKTLSELNKTTKEKLEELNLPRINRDYSSLLKSLRELYP
jgi:hypothetical protein